MPPQHVVFYKKLVGQNIGHTQTVRQGCLLSFLVFNIEAIMQATEAYVELAGTYTSN